ncbi:hypothetical protein ACRN9G_00005, partial [Shewanella frigidimarina]
FMAFTRGNFCLAINLITKCHECSSVFNLSHYFYSFFCGDSSGLEFKPEELRSCKIFEIRNSFAAHGANREGRDEKEHSFILDRHALQSGKISGYSANHESGFASHDTDISELLAEWDEVLDKHLNYIFHKVQMNNETAT